MIAQTKLQIRRGEVYLAKWGKIFEEVHILDVIKRPEGKSMIRHQHGWETLQDFWESDPVRIGRTRRILGVRCGVIRERPNVEAEAAKEKR